MGDTANEIKAELAQRIRAEIARRNASNSLADFVLYTKPDYQMGWFHREICEALDRFLQDVIDKKSPRLIITAPPRHGKSELTSRRFPAYALGKYPDLEIIACSYSAELTSLMNKDVQGIIDDECYNGVFPDTSLQGSLYAPDTGVKVARTADYFKVVGHKGHYRSTGVGGSITGMGAHVLIIDDPVKDRESANSPTIRTKTWDWFTSTALTRLAPGGGVIIMCTRWHCDDLVGHVLHNAETGQGDAYQLVNYPAIAEHDEKHRHIGEPLHPERFNLEALKGIRQNVGPRDWAALYQQRPVPDGGALFQDSWIHYYKPDELPHLHEFNKLVISWDMTFKATNTSDYVVGQVWGRKDANFYLLDQVRGRMDFVKTQEAFEALAKKWPDVHRKLVEDKANGPAIIASLKSKVTGIIPINPKESKEARANAVTTFWEAGNVFIPDPSIAPWVARDFIPELLRFPADAHDDQVDAMTQAINDLKGHSKQIHPSNIAYLNRQSYTL